MGRLMISSSQMCISREQEEFLAAYRTDEARQAFIDSYGKEKVNFLDGGYGENTIENGYPNIPYLYDYQVEYLEMNDADNLCYLDLGIVLEENVYDVLGEFALLGYTDKRDSNVIWYGCRNTFIGLLRYNITISKTITNELSATSNIGGFGFDRGVHFVVSKNTKYSILQKQSGETYVNGDYIGKSNIGYSNVGINSFKIFYDEILDDYTYGRIYAIKIWKYGILIHDYIPVVRNGIGYMYDRFSGKLFGAQGVGSFIVGPQI